MRGSEQDPSTRIRFGAAVTWERTQSDTPAGYLDTRAYCSPASMKTGAIHRSTDSPHRAVGRQGGKGGQPRTGDQGRLSEVERENRDGLIEAFGVDCWCFRPAQSFAFGEGAHDLGGE